MDYSPLTQTDLKDTTLERLNRVLKFIQGQVGRVQGLAGPFGFQDQIRFPGATMPGTNLPNDGEAVLNRTQIEKLIPIVVNESLLTKTIVVSTGGGGGGVVPSSDTSVSLDGETVSY